MWHMLIQLQTGITWQTLSGGWFPDGSCSVTVRSDSQTGMTCQILFHGDRWFTDQHLTSMWGLSHSQSQIIAKLMVNFSFSPCAASSTVRLTIPLRPLHASLRTVIVTSNITWEQQNSDDDGGGGGGGGGDDDDDHNDDGDDNNDDNVDNNDNGNNNILMTIMMMLMTSRQINSRQHICRMGNQRKMTFSSCETCHIRRACSRSTASIYVEHWRHFTRCSHWKCSLKGEGFQ